MNIVFEKLEMIVDFFVEQWHKMTKDKRGEDDLSGLLWITGLLILIIDIFTKKISLLVIGLLLVGYGIFRCFSPFGFHDKENEIFAGFFRFLRGIGIRIGGAVSDKYKSFQEVDKKEKLNELKNKVVPDEETKLERAEEKEMKKKYYMFDCPGCNQKVRTPNRGKKGRVAIVCPACKTRFVRMRW